MKIEINCRGWAAVCRAFNIGIVVCIVILGIGHTIGTEIEAMDPIQMTWLMMITYLAVLWLFINKLQHCLEEIAEEEDEKNDDGSGDNGSDARSAD